MNTLRLQASIAQDKLNLMEFEHKLDNSLIIRT